MKSAAIYKELIIFSCFLPGKLLEQFSTAVTSKVKKKCGTEE